MTISPRQRILTTFALFSFLVLATFAFLYLWMFPRLHELRQELDNQRATFAALEEQQSNLQALKQEADQIDTYTKMLDAEVWSFTKEDAFYDQLSRIVAAHDCSMDDPIVSDAIPGSKVLSRSVTLSVRGSTTNVQLVIADLQKLQPVFAIQTLSLSGDTTSVLKITATTLWQ